MLKQRSKTVHKKAQKATKNIKRYNKKIRKIQKKVTKSSGKTKIRLVRKLRHLKD